MGAKKGLKMIELLDGAEAVVVDFRWEGIHLSSGIKGRVDILPGY